MGIPVRLPGVVMFIVVTIRRKLLQPSVDIFDQPRFVVIDVNAGGNVHGRDQDHALFYSAAFDNGFDLRRDVYILPMFARMKRKVFSVGLHLASMPRELNQ